MFLARSWQPDGLVPEINLRKLVRIFTTDEPSLNYDCIIIATFPSKGLFSWAQPLNWSSNKILLLKSNMRKTPRIKLNCVILLVLSKIVQILASAISINDYFGSL